MRCAIGRVVNFYNAGVATGFNPTTLSYNASVVKIYSATNSMARFYYKNYFSLTLKHSSLLQRWRCCFQFKKS
jgi:hypothetical protein